MGRKDTWQRGLAVAAVLSIELGAGRELCAGERRTHKAGAAILLGPGTGGVHIAQHHVLVAICPHLNAAMIKRISLCPISSIPCPSAFLKISHICYSCDIY